MVFKVLYLNGRRGRLQAGIALQIRGERGADIVVVAEAVEHLHRKNHHPAYSL